MRLPIAAVTACIALGCGGLSGGGGSARFVPPKPVDTSQGPIHLPAAPADVDAYSLHTSYGLPESPGLSWAPIVVRLPAGHGDDLWLATPAWATGLAAVRVVTADDGADWGIFWLPGGATAELTLWDGDRAVPIRASPLHWFTNGTVEYWDVAFAYRGRCTPGAHLQQTATLAVTGDRWRTLRFVSRISCPDAPAGRFAAVDAPGRVGPLWLALEDLDGAGAEITMCVARLLANPPRGPEGQPCHLELFHQLGGGVESTFAASEVGVAEAPRTGGPPPIVPLVRPAPPREGERHLDRDLLDHWAEPVSVVDVDGRHWTEVLGTWGPEIYTPTAEDMLQQRLLWPRDSRVEAAPSVRCTPLTMTVRDGSRAGSVGRVDFGEAVRCLRIDAASTGPGPDGYETGVAVVSELLLRGTAWRIDAERWDFAELVQVPGRSQVVRTEALPSGRNTASWRRTVLSDHPAEPGPAVGVCTRRPPLSDVPNDVAARCGSPTKRPAVLVATVLPDGTVPWAEVHGAPDPAYAACAVEAARAAKLPPTGCPQLPLLVPLY